MGERGTERGHATQAARTSPFPPLSPTHWLSVKAGRPLLYTHHSTYDPRLTASGPFSPPHTPSYPTSLGHKHTIMPSGSASSAHPLLTHRSHQRPRPEAPPPHGSRFPSHGTPYILLSLSSLPTIPFPPTHTNREGGLLTPADTPTAPRPARPRTYPLPPPPVPTEPLPPSLLSSSPTFPPPRKAPRETREPWHPGPAGVQQSLESRHFFSILFGALRARVARSSMLV